MELFVYGEYSRGGNRFIRLQIYEKLTDVYDAKIQKMLKLSK